MKVIKIYNFTENDVEAIDYLSKKFHLKTTNKVFLEALHGYIYLENELEKASQELEALKEWKVNTLETLDNFSKSLNQINQLVNDK
jgi:hypothetical protein